MTHHPVVAAFDFDGTLTYRDTLFPFLLFTHGYPKAFLKLFLLAPWLIGYLVGLVSRQKAKERVIGSFYGGRKIDEVLSLGEKFAMKRIPSLLRPEALEKIRQHRSQGHRCVVVSASLDVYLSPWAEVVGIDAVIASRLETDGQGRITGNLLGLNCWGPEKVRRLEEVLGPSEEYTLYAYGDSRGDRELLAKADYPVHVKKQGLHEQP